MPCYIMPLVNNSLGGEHRHTDTDMHAHAQTHTHTNWQPGIKPSKISEILSAACYKVIMQVLMNNSFVVYKLFGYSAIRLWLVLSCQNLN